jgi:hypothetical protein
VNNELERMWKEVVIAEFKVLLWHLPGGAEQNPEKPQNDWSLGRDSNPELPRY